VPDDPAYTISDLARLTGLNVRTIRYYIAQGLIPASGEAGPGAHYGQGHLDRLRLTKLLQQQHLPLSEIRQRLAALSDAEVAGLLETTPEPGAPETSALDYVRSILGSRDRPSSAPPAPATPSAPAAPNEHLLGPAPALPAEPPPTPSLPSMSMEAAAVMRPGKRLDPRRLGLMSLREPPPPMSRLLPLPEVLRRAGPSEMPRMKDVPAPDPRVAAAEASGATEGAQLPERSHWERLSLGPNIELHVRRPLGRLEQRRVERLITIARQVLKEDGV